jgi:ABC-type transporter Mla subunit MlaD
MGARAAKTPQVGRYTLFARFRDAAGLAKGTKVVVRGVPVGQVTGTEADGKLARVAFELDGGVAVKRGAKLTRRQSTTLGENLLELELGDGEALGPACPGYDDKDRGVADRCREVTHVVEASLPPG